MRRNSRSHCLFSMSLLVVALSAGQAARSQTPALPSFTPTASPTPSLEKEFFKNILRDQKAIWTAPFQLDRKDAKWMVPAGIGTMTLIATDRITGDEMAEFDRQLKASRIISYAGSTYGGGAIVTAFYLVGRMRNDARARETGILSAEALVDGAIVGGGLKGITQRARPMAGSDRSEFFEGGSSFPSGHSIQAWAVATVIAHEYHERRTVQIAAYTVASAVSLARFTGERHYLSDVLVGSALGYAIGQYVYHTHHRKESASSDQEDGTLESSRWLAITPRYDRRARQYGVALTWSF